MSEGRTAPPEGTAALQLGRYQLVRLIQSGGMARVYEGRRESLAGVSVKVAIKVIRPEHAADDTFRTLFINEARIGAQLHHQNLVQIQDFDQEGDRFYLVMEYVEGITLRKLISLARRAGQPVPMSFIAEIGRQACDGLYYFHNARSELGTPLRLVHRDIKPSNLIINRQGVVKILDFGISKALIAAEKEGSVKGTWGYMSPEQATGAEIDGAADQYALAALLYELVALRPLFPDRSPEKVRDDMLADAPAARAAQLGGDWAPLGRVLVRALQRDPSARFPDMRAMGEVLFRLVEDPVRIGERLLAYSTSLATGQPSGTPTESPRSHDTMSRPEVSRPARSGPYSGGVPVGVGDRQRPRRPPPPAARPRSMLTRSRAITPGYVALVIFGLGVIGFTSYQLFFSGVAEEELPEPPAAVAAATAAGGAATAAAGDGAASEGEAAGDAPGDGALAGAAAGGAAAGGAAAGGASVASGDAAGGAAPGAVGGAASGGAATAASGGAVGGGASGSSGAAAGGAVAGAVGGAATGGAASGGAPSGASGGAAAGAAGGGVAAGGAAASAASGDAAGALQDRDDRAAARAAAIAGLLQQEAAGEGGSAGAGDEPGAAVEVVRVGQREPEPQPAVGAVTISSVPRARVVVDGSFVRYTPLFKYALPTGPHSVELATDDGRVKAFRVDVSAEAEVRRVWLFDEARWAD